MDKKEKKIDKKSCQTGLFYEERQDTHALGNYSIKKCRQRRGTQLTKRKSLLYSNVHERILTRSQRLIVNVSSALCKRF